MKQKIAYIDSELKINFCKKTVGQNIFIRTVGQNIFKLTPPQLIKRNLFRIMYQKIKSPMYITFMPSETESEAAAGTWETHIFQFILSHGSLGHPLELLGRLKNFIP